MSRERVLVVDDEPGMVRTVERILSSRYDVATATTADEALSAAGRARVDLAILDVRMPVVDGFGLLDRLREIRPETDVIFMTGVVHELDVQIIRSIREHAFYFVQKPFDREVLLTLVERCLELRRLQHANREHVRRLESELDQARVFQHSLLAPENGRVADVEIAACYRPSAALGGDLYAWAAGADESLAALVVDVVGHGAQAAMLTGIVKSAFDAAQKERWEPVAVVRRVADALRSFDARRYVTLFALRYQPREQAFEWVNAGHPPAVHLGRGRLMRLSATGLVVSPAFHDGRWEQQRTELLPGERVLLYTDGVTESEGTDGAFGERRLCEAFAACPPGAAAALDHLSATVRAHEDNRPPSDDQTLLLLARSG